MTRSLPRLAWILCAALCVTVLYAAHSWRIGRAEAEALRARSEAAQARLEAAGYETTLATISGNLRDVLAERDHWQALAEEYEARPVTIVEATAEVETRVETDTIEVTPTGFAGRAGDDVFDVEWALWTEPPRFMADVRATVPLELVHYELPDGTLGVTAASRDSRVRVRVDDVLWSPPTLPDPPSRLRWALVGFALGVGLESLR